MAIEFYSLFNLGHFDETYFREEMQAFFSKSNGHARLRDAKVFFIHRPRINNLVNTDIDLLLIIVVENKQGNYYIVKNNENNDHCYFKNLVIPIKFVGQFHANPIEIAQDGTKSIDWTNITVFDNDYFEINYENEIKEMIYKTRSYLLNLFDRKNSKIDVKPIIWILKSDNQFEFDKSHILIAPKFGFYELEAYLKFSKIYFFNSIPEWAEPNNVASYLLAQNDINKLIKEVEKNAELGKLTKDKINRIANKYNEDLKIYEKYLAEQEHSGNDIFSLSNAKSKKRTKLTRNIELYQEMKSRLILIEGKAGSGKSTELLLLIDKCYKDNIQTRYLTYNKLLTYETQNQLRERQNNSYSTSIRTLHKFFFDITSNLKILHMMGEKRVSELKDKLNKRINSIFLFIESNNGKNPTISQIKEITLSLDKETRLLLFMYIDDLNRRINDKKQDFGSKKFNIIHQEKYLNALKENREKHLVNLVIKEIFLTDYYNVLRNLSIAIDDPLFLLKNLEFAAENFKNNFNKDKNNPESYWNTKVGEQVVVEYFNRSLSGFTKYALFVDEGQDCHPFEKDILLKLHKRKNIVVANGGKEQLIRHDNICNWHIDYDKKPLNPVIFDKGGACYRLKPELAKLCNYISEQFNINLNLKSQTTDSGTVVININNNTAFSKDFHQLYLKGKNNKCSNYENTLFLLEPTSNIFFKDREKEVLNESISIDEYDNMHITQEPVGSKHVVLYEMISATSEVQQEILKEDIFYYNMRYISDDESEENENNDENIPTPNQFRAIYYESCRGLEAWSVMCFDIDLFFERKRQEEQAGLFRSDDLFYSEEERRSMYAATWVLMALTRAIDTLYIHISDPTSQFGKIISDYAILKK